MSKSQFPPEGFDLHLIIGPLRRGRSLPQAKKQLIPLNLDGRFIHIPSILAKSAPLETHEFNWQDYYTRTLAALALTSVIDKTPPGE